jgi:hypothetical protein
MQRVVVPFPLGRQAPFLSMNKALPAHRWFFALMPALDIASEHLSKVAVFLVHFSNL